MHHRTKKQFGQNFLQDEFVIQHIIQAIRPQKDDHMIEIGPGLGALTFPLLHYLQSLTVIDIDRDIIAHLEKSVYVEQKRIKILHQDVLTVDFSTFQSPIRLVGNLPYNISSPLLLHVLTGQFPIVDMHFMLQKEVVERLAASPGSKAYGRLSIMAQYHSEVVPLFDVPPEAFRPQPKVDSSVVRLTPRPYPSPLVNLPFSHLEKVVAKAFGMRRKTLANNLKPYLSATELTQLGITPTLRPEDISIDAYLQIANYLLESGKNHVQ